MASLAQLPSKIAILTITFYQKTLSPDHGWLKARYPHGYCRHYPSCSDYTKESISRLGLLKGGFFGAKRILKCNPWVSPSVDPVPSK